MHEYLITGPDGDVLDVLPMCSDACHRAYARDDYNGWNGAHQTEHTTFCASCGVVIGADDDDTCDCQLRNVVVNRFVTDDGEQCPHGNWIQLPAGMLESR